MAENNQTPEQIADDVHGQLPQEDIRIVLQRIELRLTALERDRPSDPSVAIDMLRKQLSDLADQIAMLSSASKSQAKSVADHATSQAITSVNKRIEALNETTLQAVGEVLRDLRSEIHAGIADAEKRLTAQAVTLAEVGGSQFAHSESVVREYLNQFSPTHTL